MSWEKPPKHNNMVKFQFFFCLRWLISSEFYICIRLIVEFLLLPPSAVGRVIKPKSPTVREWNSPNRGLQNQPIRTQHPKAGYQSGVCAGWRDPRETFFFFFSPLHFPHSPLLGYHCADGTLWLNVRPPTPPPPRVCSGAAEKLWLTPGRNPVAATIYRKGQSHICIWSLWETEARWENEERGVKDTVHFENK